jgi:hypothetical protein
MNAGQQRFADANQALGHLLVQVDMFYQSLPEAVRKAFDRLGDAPAPHGCYVDLGSDEKPDACVMDCGDFDDCSTARRLQAAGKTKTSCEHWLPIKLQF